GPHAVIHRGNGKTAVFHREREPEQGRIPLDAVPGHLAAHPQGLTDDPVPPGQQLTDGEIIHGRLGNGGGDQIHDGPRHHPQGQGHTALAPRHGPHSFLNARAIPYAQYSTPPLSKRKFYGTSRGRYALLTTLARPWPQGKGSAVPIDGLRKEGEKGPAPLPARVRAPARHRSAGLGSRLR